MNRLLKTPFVFVLRYPTDGFAGLLWWLASLALMVVPERIGSAPVLVVTLAVLGTASLVIFIFVAMLAAILMYQRLGEEEEASRISASAIAASKTRILLMGAVTGKCTICLEEMDHVTKERKPIAYCAFCTALVGCLKCTKKWQRFTDRRIEDGGARCLICRVAWQNKKTDFSTAEFKRVMVS